MSKAVVSVQGLAPLRQAHPTKKSGRERTIAQASTFTQQPREDERRSISAQTGMAGQRPLSRRRGAGHQEAASHCPQAGSARLGQEKGRLHNRRPVVDARFRRQSEEHWKWPGGISSHDYACWHDLIIEQSTLSQIQKKGINRGGLYGFFVKGESIAGTLGDSDSSGAPTDASAAPSGTSTPATSASDSEPAKKKTKRKRDADKGSSKSKKSKSKGEDTPSGRDEKKLAKKIAKLSVDEKSEYEKRAAAKGQTLEAYVARRIQKKSEQRKAR